MVMVELDICPISATLNANKEIVATTVQDMEVGLKISTNIPYSMLEKVLMALGELDIDIGPALLHPITQVIMLDHLIL